MFFIRLVFNKVLVSCSYQIIMTVDKEKHPIEGPIYYYMFNTLLFCLLVLHIFWWVLIYRMLVKQVQDRGKLSEDVRSGMFSENLIWLCMICMFWMVNQVCVCISADSESDDEHEDWLQLWDTLFL